MSAGLDNVTEAITAGIGQHEPEGALEIRDRLAELPAVWEELGAAVRTYADRLADAYPVDASVSEHLSDVAAATTGLADQAREAHSAFTSAHADDLARLENPRPGEEHWDTVKNG